MSPSRSGAILEPRHVLGAADALDAEGALLHDAARPHRDVRVELQVERLGERLLVVVEPVEVAHLVGAVVGAVARADAAVVHLAVEAVRRVVRRVHRADRLARRVVAVLAHHRDEARLDRLAVRRRPPSSARSASSSSRGRAAPASSPTHGDVVLGVAGGDAGGAAGAA